MQAVDIDNIVGSEDRCQDFSRHFFPRKEHLRSRWMSIDRAHLTDIILSRFPGRTEADLYIWIIKHRHSLKERFGPEYSLGRAASDYSAAHGKGPLRRFLGFFKRLFGRKSKPERP